MCVQLAEALAQSAMTDQQAPQDERTGPLRAAREKRAVRLRVAQDERKVDLQALAEYEVEMNASPGREALAADSAALDSEIAEAAAKESRVRLNLRGAPARR